MNPAEAPFLYLPVFYWGAFVLFLYRHDLSRLTHPFRDRSGLRRWWSIFLRTGLLSPEQATRKPRKVRQIIPLLACVIAASGLSLAWTIPAFQSNWYCLAALQVVSGVVLTMGTVWHLGPPPRRPYADVLGYPRLGSRIRHLQVPPPATSAPPESGPKTEMKIRFFNVSLRNGTVVSTPSYPEEQAFVGALVRALEGANPDFAWIQFLFAKSNHSSALVGLKNSIQRAKVEIERPSLDFLSGQERVKKEIRRDFYRQADARIRKADEMVPKPLATLAIQGMWVTSKEPSLIESLPFDHCADEHDSLAIFQYRDPRMLAEVVNRRMVADIGEYFRRYTKSRLEPPSFIVTPEGLRSYVHLPAGEAVDSLRSITFGTSARGYTRATAKKDSGGDANSDAGRCSDVTSRYVKLATVPKMEIVMEDSSVQPLDHLSSATVRTFELVYHDGQTGLTLSAETVEDMRKYARLLDSIYGDLDHENVGQYPEYLRKLPEALGLGGSPAL